MLDNYSIDEFGVIHQVEWKPKEYDTEYLSYYEGLQERTIKLGYQRFGWTLGLNGSLPESVLEIGYGLGTFLEAAALAGIPRCAGCDITRYPIPAGCEFLTWDQALELEWELCAMFDVLEHIPDLSFLGRLNAKAVAIAVPWCHWEAKGDDWLRDWRMLLPDEHLHHFDPKSLRALMAHHGFTELTNNTCEDGLRLREGESGPNIFCGYFIRD